MRKRELTQKARRARAFLRESPGRGWQSWPLSQRQKLMLNTAEKMPGRKKNTWTTSIRNKPNKVEFQPERKVQEPEKNPQWHTFLTTGSQKSRKNLAIYHQYPSSRLRDKTSNSMEAISPVKGRRSGKGMRAQNDQKPHKPLLQLHEAQGLGAMHSAPVNAWAEEPESLSVLEQKVRALKEKRMLAKKQAVNVGTILVEPPSLKKGKSWGQRKSSTAMTLVSECSSSQDSIVFPQAQVQAYLADRCWDSSDDLEVGPVPNPLLGPNSTQSPSQFRFRKENQRFPERRLSDSVLSQEANYFQENSTYSRPRCHRDLAQKPSLENGKLGARAKHQVQAGALKEVSLALEQEEALPWTTLQGQLWRAGSWDSLKSSSNSWSLNDRVERNRLLLQERKSLSECSSSSHNTVAQDGTAPRLPGGDPDWDSGVSLQDSDMCRALVSSQQLSLSPRHEQANQLLQQARMKAKTSPLRANHDIVPSMAHRLPARDVSSGTIQTPRVTLACREGDVPYSGSLSDSSSGDSINDQRRKRGLSPSRVRFEDESAQDAEVRYRERLQQPQKRALDSVLRSFDQGLLVSKPELSNYINGDFCPRDTQRDETCWTPPNKGSRGGLTGKRNLLGKVPEINTEGTCHSCGSYIQGVTRDPIERKVPPRRNRSQEKEDTRNLEAQGIPHTEPSASQSLASPVWILPSRQRLNIEHIRETYIGEIAYPVEVESALDSTDTSESYRTDSEEVSIPHHRSRSRAQVSGSPRGRKAGGIQKRVRELEIEKKAEIPQAWHNQIEVDYRLEEPKRIAPEGPLFLKEDHGPMLAITEAQSISKEDERTDMPHLLAIARQICKLTHPEDTQAPYGTLNVMAPSQKLALTGPGGEAQISGNQELLKSTFPLPPNFVNPPRRSSHSSPQLAKKSPECFTLGTWVPTPPTVKKASSPGPFRKTMLARSLGPDNQRDPTNSRQVFPRESDMGLGGRTRVENQTSPSRIKHQLMVPSKSDFSSIDLREQLDIQRKEARENQREKGPGSLKPKASPEKSKDGGFWDIPELAVTSNLGSTGIEVSLTTEQPQPSVDTEDKVQKAKPSSEKIVLKGESLEDPPGPNITSAIPANGSKKGSNNSSGFGLKKFFSFLGQTTRQKLGKFRCYSMEQIAQTSPEQPQQSLIHQILNSKLKKAPSLQALQLVPPSHQRRKVDFGQNLHSLLNKAERSRQYLLGVERKDRASGGQPGSPTRHSLSVDDISVPSLVRTVGRVVQVFPDGTSQLELQRLPNGTFGFCVSTGNGRPDSGFYVQEIPHANMAKLYAGLLGEGDEILEVNGAKVTGLGLSLVNEFLAHSENLSIRVLKQRSPQR
ncbi:uncharacterized protein KIAA1614 homolog isoform X6 [Monodelphis domestica]|uniref:uncharacterized protein KIAA1614 homolog isoform X6 n=1 Tax=Monodelphis domestica TaxID=13616 RepID=UPI0024E1E15B|nr:uncharacterized protein KIAA1614 homolog isoform X6 [Monodelphis domestica]